MRMKVPVTSTMFTNQFCKLSKCVCVSGQNALKLSISRCASICLTYTAWVFIYPAQVALSEGSDRWSKDHLSITKLSKDQHSPRRMIYRSSIKGSSFEHIEGSTLSFDELSFEPDNLQSNNNCLTKSNRRMVDLVNLQD
ncbi:hypothetical protein Hdeb2414_s0015g00439781 [Helianthus debilis subsp. tardiflorus]